MNRARKEFVKLVKFVVGKEKEIEYNKVFV